MAERSRPRKLRRSVLIGALTLLFVGGLAAPSALAATQRTTGSALVQVAGVAGNLGYSYDYTTGMTWPQTQFQSARSVTTEVTGNFRRYFTFDSDCNQIPAVGGVCHLFFAGVSNPVQVSARTATGFSFLSLPGHSEGAGRTITFTFYKAGFDPFADIRMSVQASGPYSLAADLTIQSGAAFNFWNTFATNVGRAYSG
jgi:hypothetical protein